MRGILKAGLAALGLVAAGAPALADKAFDAEDAAYVDWSYRHCETMSTAKEHALADAANAGDKFHAEYLKEMHKITDVERSTDQITRLCATIQDRYGPNANLIPDLISARGEKPSDSITADKPAAQPAAPAQKRHGRPH